MLKNNKGQIRVIEAFLSMAIIFSALAVSAGFAPQSDVSGQADLARRGLQALVQLDSDGALGRMIDQTDWASLRDALRLALPVGAAFNLTVYDEGWQALNAVQISTGALGGDTVAVDYTCVTQSIQCCVYTVRLQLATVK